MFKNTQQDDDGGEVGSDVYAGSMVLIMAHLAVGYLSAPYLTRQPTAGWHLDEAQTIPKLHFTLSKRKLTRIANAREGVYSKTAFNW